MDWLLANKEWLFSGVGGLILTGLFAFMRKDTRTRGEHSDRIVINNHASSMLTPGSVPVQRPLPITDNTSSENSPLPNHRTGNNGARAKRPLEAFKNEVRILFIDDDARFKVAKILTKSGWVHTKLIKDAASLDDRDIVAAHILFIDVQGVGVELGFTDEGLGLALAVKEKYPEKKVVIYSAETKGDRFHAALRKADAFLPKNADPYEFQKIVEDFTVGAA